VALSASALIARAGKQVGVIKAPGACQRSSSRCGPGPVGCHKGAKSAATGTGPVIFYAFFFLAGEWAQPV
jgi:hypothetical protein